MQITFIRKKYNYLREFCLLKFSFYQNYFTLYFILRHILLQTHAYKNLFLYYYLYYYSSILFLYLNIDD